MTSSFPVEPKQLGTILKNDVFSRDGVIDENVTLEYYFSVGMMQAFLQRLLSKTFKMILT